MALRALGCLRALGIPIIAGGGVYDRRTYEFMLHAGATAVTLGTVLWRGKGLLEKVESGDEPWL